MFRIVYDESRRLDGEEGAMRAWFLTGAMALAVFGIVSSAPADAAVSIVVDKNAQQMTVSVDGAPRYTWPVSSGNPSHETPNGAFKAFRMEEDHYSKEFDDAPMPNSIFFTKQGHAIHGTDSVSKLGSPASHGCVRLSRANALTLWNLVKQEGVLNTSVTLTGSSQVALARNPRPRGDTVARNVTPDGQDNLYTPRQPTQIAPRVAPSFGDNGFDNDGYANRSQQQPSYQDRPYAQDNARAAPYGNSYYGADPRGPQQRRVTRDPGDYESYDERDARYQRQPYYYGRRGYWE